MLTIGYVNDIMLNTSKFHNYDERCCKIEECSIVKVGQLDYE